MHIFYFNFFQRVIEEKNGEIRELREKLSLHTYLPKASADSEDNRVAALSQVKTPETCMKILRVHSDLN